jgi:hypothetical protein
MGLDEVRLQPVHVGGVHRCLTAAAIHSAPEALCRSVPGGRGDAALDSSRHVHRALRDRATSAPFRGEMRDRASDVCLAADKHSAASRLRSRERSPDIASRTPRRQCN